MKSWLTHLCHLYSQPMVILVIDKSQRFCYVCTFDYNLNLVLLIFMIGNIHDYEKLRKASLASMFLC